MGGTEGAELRKQLRSLRRVFLYFGKPSTSSTQEESERGEWEIELENHAWLERQMHPSDREKFPVIFTDRMDFSAYVKAGHDHLWEHAIGGGGSSGHSRTT